MKQKKRLVLIDGHSVLFRAYHAYPPLTTSKGELINAVYGFTSILLNVIGQLEPTHLAVTFDRDKPTFRHIEFVGYKAKREEMPTELADQQGRVGEVLAALNVPVFSVEGYEADDVIGTLARQAESDKRQATRNKVDEVVIVTGDQDALQLVDSKVHVYVPGRGKEPARIFSEKLVEEKYNLKPEQIPDMKALAGDASDNIPGVRGIGPKMAAILLNKYSTVEKLYEALLKRPKGKHKGTPAEKELPAAVVKKLIDGYDSAILSKKLATIVTDTPVDLDLAQCELKDYDKDKAVKVFEELEFKSLIRKLPADTFERLVEDTLL